MLGAYIGPQGLTQDQLAPRLLIPCGEQFTDMNPGSSSGRLEEWQIWADLLLWRACLPYFQPTSNSSQSALIPHSKKNPHLKLSLSVFSSSRPDWTHPRREYNLVLTATTCTSTFTHYSYMTIIKLLMVTRFIITFNLAGLWLFHYNILLEGKQLLTAIFKHIKKSW